MWPAEMIMNISDAVYSHTILFLSFFCPVNWIEGKEEKMADEMRNNTKVEEQ